MKIGTSYQRQDSGKESCTFTVWAPLAETVALEIIAPEKRSLPMHSSQDGYWTIELTDVSPETQYRYQLNGQESHPDPASQLQPEGVHGASQVVDHQFEWRDREWQGISVEDLILYELHVGTFTPEGTFEAIIPRLPELKALGITAIEIMPIAQFPGTGKTNDPHAYRNWGYDGVYLYAVQNSYGGPAGLKRLVDAAHRAGLAVILDVVYNHFGPEGNYMSHFGPYFTNTYCTPWGNAINFDGAHSHHVRNFFLQNALYWLREFHIDGLRLDAIQAIYDFGAKHFLQELAEVVQEFSQQQGRPYIITAESDLNDPRLIRPFGLNGYGIDAQWSDDFHHSLYTLLTGETRGYYQDFGTCEHLAKAYRQSFVYDWQYAPHRQRFHGNCAKDCPPTQFIVCIQNHDQVANCLPGDRLAKLVGFEALKLAAGNVILSPYIPLLFMGEEYGEETPFTYFVSHSDPDLIRAVREGRKQEFIHFHAEVEPLDPEAMETFAMSRLNWDKRMEGHHQILWSFYQHLIHLRRTLPALVHRDRQCLDVNSDETSKTLTWRRWVNGDQLLCLMSFNNSEVEIRPDGAGQRWHKILDSAEAKWAGPGATAPNQWAGDVPLHLSPQSFVLYSSI